MADFLFIQPSEMASTTILGGNVDIDKYLFNIASVQITVIEPLLGSILYDKIRAEAEADTLTGLYLTLYNEFVKPITKHQALAEYIEISDILLTNGGLFRHLPENSETVSKDDKYTLSQKYSGLADMYIIRFNKWICKNPLTEYKTYQDEVNANKNISLIGGWHFSGEQPTITEYNE